MNELTLQQQLLLSKLYDDLMTFRFAKAKNHDELKALMRTLILKIDSLIKEMEEVEE